MVALQSVIASPAFAATCTLNGHVATATLAPENTGGTSFVSRDATNLTFSGQVCGALDQVDQLNIDMLGNQQALGINLQQGPLGPGFTDEGNGTSEIEISAVNVTTFHQVAVLGTTGDDVITVGERLDLLAGTIKEQINLNAGAEGSSPDVDVSFEGGSELALSSLAGNDQLLATGTGTILSRVPFKPLVFLDGAGADTVVGGRGPDHFQIGGSFDPGDSYTGGDGTDEIFMSRGAADMSISLNGLADDGEACPGIGCENDNVAADIERLSTGNGDDTIVAGPGDQVIAPSSGSNVVSGGAGRDHFDISSTGPDTVHGGIGIDVASFGLNHPGVTVTLDGTANDGTGTEGDNVFADVENLEGTADSDQLTGSPGPNHLFGGYGNDQLFGSGGSDVLEGGWGPSPLLNQNDGSDTFSGGSGTDTVRETNHVGDQQLSIDGLPNDLVLGDPAQGIDNITPDIENVVGGDGDDSIRGNGKRNKLTGGDGNDKLTGKGDADVFVPGRGKDRLFGNAGADSASFAGAASSVSANLATRRARGDGRDALTGIERLIGSKRADHLTGSRGGNVLKGSGGGDTLVGRGGNDRLAGDGGNDVLNGGAGRDRCRQGPGKGRKTSCER